MARDLAAWKRLGRLLAARRGQLNFPVLREFADATGLKLRTLTDVENGGRTTYRPATLANIEAAYRWKPGSIDLVLDGGDPMPVEGGSPTGPTIRISGVSASTEPVTNAEHIDDELARWINDALGRGVDVSDWDLNDSLEREIFVHDAFNWTEKTGMRSSLRAYRAQARERMRREQENGAPRN